MGNTQPYEPGIGPQSSITRSRHRAATGGGTGISSSRPRSTCWNRTPAYRALTPDDPSAPTSTRARTLVPSASRARARPLSSLIPRTVDCCRRVTPASAAALRSASSNSSRDTMASSGASSRRVNSRRPFRVAVMEWMVSRAGTCMCRPAATREVPIRPPPHVLYRGCSARSITTLRAPAAAAASAAVRPAGPAPTTATSHSASSATLAG